VLLRTPVGDLLFGAGLGLACVGIVLLWAVTGFAIGLLRAVRFRYTGAVSIRSWPSPARASPIR
jgi:hypothetical protein